MWTSRSSAAAALLAWTLCGPAAAVDMESLRPSIVDVSCAEEDGKAERGKGLIVGRQGPLHYVLTNRHVVQPERPCQVKVQPAGRLPVDALLLDRRYDVLDIAVVLFEANPPLPLVPIEVVDAEVGNGLSILIDNRFFDGNRVLSVLAEDVDPNQIVIEQKLAETYSGSPVFNAQGQWLGLYRGEQRILGGPRGLVIRSEAIARALDFLAVPANLLARGGQTAARKAFRSRISASLNEWEVLLHTLVGVYERYAPATLDFIKNYDLLEEVGKTYADSWMELNSQKFQQIEEVERLWGVEMASEYRAFFEKWVVGTHERIVFQGVPGNHRGINGIHADTNLILQKLPRRTSERLPKKRSIEEAVAKVRADLDSLRPELQDQINAMMNRLYSGPLQ